MGRYSPSPDSILEGVQSQCNAMLTQAKRASERGYVVLAHNLNHTTEHDKFLFEPLQEGFILFLREWNRRTKQRILILRVTPYLDNFEVQIADWRANPFSLGLRFEVRIPTTKPFGAIHAALNLMSMLVSSRWNGYTEVAPTPFKHIKMRACNEYYGSNRDALIILLKILDMPQHRDILTGKT